jgi:hypothetical protein
LAIYPIDYDEFTLISLLYVSLPHGTKLLIPLFRTGNEGDTNMHRAPRFALRRVKMTAWINHNTPWLADRDHPEKTRARIMALALSLIPLIMAGVLAWR